MSQRTPAIIGHRGCAGLRPENSMAAFTHALELGIEGIELDVHLTKDDVIVVYHDESLNKNYTRDGWGKWLRKPTPQLHEMTWEETQSYDIGRLDPEVNKHPGQVPVDGALIPRLEDVIRLLKDAPNKDLRLFLELKTSAFLPIPRREGEKLTDVVLDMIEALNFADQTTLVSFDWSTLVRAKKSAPQIRNAFTTLPFFWMDETHAPEDFGDKAEMITHFRTNTKDDRAAWAGFDWRDQAGDDVNDKVLKAIHEGPADGWFAWHGDINAETVAQAKSYDLEVSCWTVNDRPEFERVRDEGVACVITDRPDLMVK